MFDEHSWRESDLATATVEWAAYVGDRKKERDRSPKRVLYMREYLKSYEKRDDVRERRRQRQSSEDYLAKRRVYAANYRKANPEQRAKAVERCRRWREARAAA